MTEFHVFHRNHILPSDRGRILPLVLLNVWYGHTLNLHIDVLPRPPGCQDFVVRTFREQDPAHPALIDWENTQIYQLALPPLGPPHHWLYPQFDQNSSIDSPEVIQHPLSLNTSRRRSPSDPGLWQYREPDFEIPYTYQPRQFLRELNESLESNGEKGLSQVLQCRSYNFWVTEDTSVDSAVQTADIEISQSGNFEDIYELEEASEVITPPIIVSDVKHFSAHEVLSADSSHPQDPSASKSHQHSPDLVSERLDTVPLSGYGLTFFGYHEPIPHLVGPSSHELELSREPPPLNPDRSRTGTLEGLWHPPGTLGQPSFGGPTRLWHDDAAVQSRSCELNPTFGIALDTDNPSRQL